MPIKCHKVCELHFFWVPLFFIRILDSEINLFIKTTRVIFLFWITLMDSNLDLDVSRSLNFTRKLWCQNGSSRNNQGLINSRFTSISPSFQWNQYDWRHQGQGHRYYGKLVVINPKFMEANLIDKIRSTELLLRSNSLWCQCELHTTEWHILKPFWLIFFIWNAVCSRSIG